MSRIYVETTIPSFSHEVRAAPMMVARRQWTREWFDGARGRDELVASIAVLDELRRGSFPGRDDAVEMIRRLALLGVTERAIEVAQEYVNRKVMPAGLHGDALHLAVASVYDCEFLATWNCRHLANANKYGHIAQVNRSLGLTIPALVTPLELIGKSADDA